MDYEYLDDTLIHQGQFYDKQSLPSQISNAIYQYGDNSDFDLLAYIDISEHQDGSKGMIITQKGIYFNLAMPGKIIYQDIVQIALKKPLLQDTLIAFIKTKDKAYQFKDYIINALQLIQFLSEITGLKIDYLMNDYEKIEYFVPIVLQDLLDDIYEDIALDEDTTKKITDMQEELQTIRSLSMNEYQDELMLLNNKASALFDELALDSEEIDQLIQVQTNLQSQEDQRYNQFKNYYDQMMDQYKNGNTGQFDQIQTMMNRLGLDENTLKNKSPEELNQILEDLCSRFGISKSQIERMAQRLNK